MTLYTGKILVLSIQLEGGPVMIKFACRPVSITMAIQTIFATHFLKLAIMYILVATHAA